MKLLIADDEYLARQRLQRMTSHLEGYKLVGEASSGPEALEKIKTLEPDIVLLDICMPGLTGLEVARKLIEEMENPPAIIFCTAYGEYAIEAFDVQAIAYLLKPVRQESLISALTKAQRVNKVQLAAIEENSLRKEGMRTHITAKTYKGMELIPINDIYYFVADQKYVTVRYQGGQVLIDDTLKDLEKEFAGRFVRIHRNALVAVAYLEGLEKGYTSHYEIRIKGLNERLAVSRRHAPGVKKVMQSL